MINGVRKEMSKVSEMLVAVSGQLLTTVGNVEEMQAHLDLVKMAWNMSLYSDNKRKSKLKKFIETQQKYAPNEEALKALEWEFRRIMKRKDKLFSNVKSKVEMAEAIETSKDNYVIRAYFTGGDERG